MQASEIIVTPESKKALGATLLEDVDVRQQPSSRKIRRLFVLDTQAIVRTVDGLKAGQRKRSENTFLFFASSTDPKIFSVLTATRRYLDAEPFVTESIEVLRRVVRANATGAADKLIARADVVDGKLLVWSCEPRLYECPIAVIPALAYGAPEKLNRFEVSSSGSRIHWPDIDVDIDLETIRYCSDAEFRETVDRATRKRTQKYGKAIRALREEHGLSQSGIEGLTDRQVRRLEAGEVQPHFSTLEKMATAHDMTVRAYLGELASRSQQARRVTSVLSRSGSQ